MSSSRAKSESTKAARGRPQPDPPVLSEANDEMLSSIKAMMDDLRTEIVTKFEAIVSASVKKEVASALIPLEGIIDRQSESISDLEHSASEHSDKLTDMHANMAKLSAAVETLTKKCEDLEARSRWNNIQVVGLPEGTEGPRPTEFMAGLLKDILGLEEKPGLDRAHRTLRARPGEGEPPRPMVVRVTQFQVRNAILRRAGEASPLLYNGKRVFIFPDFTPSVAKQRAAFSKVKKELHACGNVKFGLRYPATLHITVSGGQTHKFVDPDRALEFVNKRLKKNPDPEGD